MATGNRNRIWYDVTMSLTYPSVLGAVIYFFFDSVVQVSVLPLWDRWTAVLDSTFVPQIVQYRFFESFGLPGSVGFLAFLAVTLLVIVHHSADYLYSKYSEGYYDFANFAWDTVLSLLLAIAYIILSTAASRDFFHLKLAFAVFWGCFVLSYAIFIWWDLRAYRDLRETDVAQANFYLGMVRWFEVAALLVFAALAVIVLFVQEPGAFSRIYVMVSLLTLGFSTVSFGMKVGDLEAMTRSAQPPSLLAGEIALDQQSVKRDISIREMTLDEIRACAAIFVSAYREVYSEPWTQETAEARLSEMYRIAPEYSFVLTLDGDIVGFLSARPFSWHDGTRIWIEEIVIEHQHRGQGLGKLLFQACIDVCRTRKNVEISLLSQRGSMAFGMYEKIGFHASDWMHLEMDLEPLTSATDSSTVEKSHE